MKPYWGKYGMNKFHKHHLTVKLWFILPIIFLLNGCDLTYPSKYKAQIQIEQAWVDEDVFIENRLTDLNSFNQLTFTTFNPDQIIDFKKNKKYFLLKITTLDEPNDIYEFTLNLFPKYISQVSYFNQSKQNIFSETVTLYRNKVDENRYFSSQRFAFNIDHTNFKNTHFLLLKSVSNRYAHVEIVDSKSYIKSDANFSHFFTMVYSIIIAMILFNAVFYLYSKDVSYFLYTLYMITALYSLLWQEGKINDLPWLAWHVIGVHSSLLFFIIYDAVAIMFFYRFMGLNFRKSWLAAVVLLCVVFRLGIMFTALTQYHLLNNLQYNLLSNLFNLSVIVSSLLVWIIMLIKTIQKFPQAKFLFMAWSLLIITVVLRVYFAFNPHPDLLWMSHSYELGIMLEGLILAFAMANRTMEFKKQRDQALSKFTAAEQSIKDHRSVTEFQHQMQNLVKDPALSITEVTEKINIKFHMLINKAFPIKNSLIHVNKKLSGICTTGLQSIDIELLNFKLNEILAPKKHNQISQFEIITANNKTMSFLYLPLNPEEFNQTSFIFGLKNNQVIDPKLVNEFKSYCETAYAALNQAREVHQVALAANLDSMTGAHNRGSIEQVITESLHKASRTTLAYIDLDNLKKINDQHGHSTGDEAIIDFVTLLTETIDGYAKLGRIGGDEFIAVFSDIDFDYSEELLNQFMHLLVNKKLTSQNLSITTSIGLAESRINETLETLLNKADLALYHSKALGKNQLTIYSNQLQNSITAD